MEIELGIEPPPRKVTQKRVTPELRAMPVGASFVCDFGMATAFRTWAVNQGWKVRQKKGEDGSYRVWRVG